MIVVVGGASRKSGKTQVICDIISATRSAAWTAVKITPHRHGPREHPAADTARYLEAGAASAHLITGTPPIALPSAKNLIIESNSVLDQLTPDLFIFVTGPALTEYKPSALRLRNRADIVLSARATEQVLEQVRGALALA